MSTQLEALYTEFDRRAHNCVTDPTINEINGLEFKKLRDWTCECLHRETVEVGARFDTLLENVNYNLAQANATFKKK